MAWASNILGALRNAVARVFGHNGGIKDKRNAIVTPDMDQKKVVNIRHPKSKKSTKGSKEQKKIVLKFKEIEILNVDAPSNRKGKFKIKADGNIYTVSQFADILGMPLGTLYGRILKGWDIDKILTEARISNRDYRKCPPIKAKLWEWKGEKHTVSEWAKIYGIKNAMMRLRLTTYGNPERNTEKQDRYNANRAKRHTWNGETHTVKEWAKIYKVPERTMFGRLKAHGSPEAVDRSPAKKYTWGGQSKTAAEWAKEYGCSPNAIKKRFNSHGSPCLIRVTTSKTSKTSEGEEELHMYNGQMKTVSQWAKVFNLSKRKVERNLIRYGQPIKPLEEDILPEQESEEETEEEIDKIMEEYTTKDAKKQESVREWITRLREEPDDGRPLRNILCVDDFGDLLSGAV